MNEDRPQEDSNLPLLDAQLGEFSKLSPRKMNEDRPQEDSNLPLLDAQLGEFSKLPLELRFQIWNCVFDNFLKHPSNTPRPLSILSCNRSLYEEISQILYERHILNLRIMVGFLDDMKLHFSAGMLKVANHGKSFRFFKAIRLNHFDDVLRLIRNFPSWRFQKCAPWIDIWYDYLLDHKAELRLWECVYKIVNTLKLIPNGKNITFRTFVPWPQRLGNIREPEPNGELMKWFNERFPGEPVPPRSFGPPDDYDHDHPPRTVAEDTILSLYDVAGHRFHRAKAT